MERQLTIGRTTFLVRRQPKPKTGAPLWTPQTTSAWQKIFNATWAAKAGGKIEGLPYQKKHEE